MTREEVLQDILALNKNNILCELATSFGKTKIAIEILKRRGAKDILIVVPRKVLMNGWRAEIHKWYPTNTWNITFTTYISYPKHAGKWDAVIYDECHHLSERCRENVKYFDSNLNILLSATVSQSLKHSLKHLFRGLEIYTVSARIAIESNILPDPKVILLPMTLDNENPCHEIIIGKGNTIPIKTTYNNIWNAKKDKKHSYKVSCTEQQYYNEISGLVDWYKKKAMGGNQILKNLWLRKCGERLKWLSDRKTGKVYEILRKLDRYRTLTFCNSIEHSTLLGKYCINSKNALSDKYKFMFDNGEINHITAVNMLNEGVNLTNCRVGIYAVLNSSETLIQQKLGRLLRHKSPVIIIPYYIGTRDEEIVEKMLKDYNPELIVRINSVKELTI